VIEEVPDIEVPSTDEQRMDASDRRAFTEDEMEMFLWALAIMGEGRALRIYIALFETWQRKSTIEALTLRWLNFHNETITIPAKHFKTRKEKVIDARRRCAGGRTRRARSMSTRRAASSRGPAGWLASTATA
jgi:hypothetical protein